MYITNGVEGEKESERKRKENLLLGTEAGGLFQQN